MQRIQNNGMLLINSLLGLLVEDEKQIFMKKNVVSFSLFISAATVIDTFKIDI